MNYHTALNLKEFELAHYPAFLKKIELSPPDTEQKVLRLLIQEPFSDICLPTYYEWTRPIINAAQEAQSQLGIRQPFVYLTIRHGVVDYTKDDVWHTDGFSLQYAHLPQQSYLWVDHTPTEFISSRFFFPKDFDSLKHDLHLFIQDCIKEGKPSLDKKYDNWYDDWYERPNFTEGQAKVLTRLDPYVIHRRPSSLQGQHRTLVRVAFTPIEIMDCNNEVNPFFPHRTYSRDGVKDFRDKLVRYTC